MKKIATLLSALTFAAVIGQIRSTEANPVRDHQTLLKTIVLNMGKDGAAVTDARYNDEFKGGDASTGVAAIIRAGKFFINGYMLPGTASAFRQKYPTGYMVNQVPWLTYDTGASVWKGGYKAEKSVASFAEAALATATSIVAGLEIRLYDTDGDGYADLVDADYKEGVIADRITRNDDGTYSVYRGDIDTANKTPMEGRTFDSAHFTSTSGERIKADNFDPSIAAGDVALFWYEPEGWTMERARQVRGAFLGGTDHESYNIGGIVYQDAMRFSRDNIPVSNRPGEYVNALAYFGFDKTNLGSEVSLWLVPTTDPEAQGAPVSLTSGDSARVILAKAIEYSEAKLMSVTVSADGRDVPSDKKWVNQATYTQLSEAVERARKALEVHHGESTLLDYQIYLLYLSLSGGANDIGAKFGGFSYAGFARELKTGTQVPD